MGRDTVQSGCARVPEQHAPMPQTSLPWRRRPRPVPVRYAGTSERAGATRCSFRATLGAPCACSALCILQSAGMSSNRPRVQPSCVPVACEHGADQNTPRGRSQGNPVDRRASCMSPTATPAALCGTGFEPCSLAESGMGRCSLARWPRALRHATPKCPGIQRRRSHGELDAADLL